MSIDILTPSAHSPVETYSPDAQLVENLRACYRAIREGEGAMEFPSLNQHILELERLVFAEPPESPSAALALSQIKGEERDWLNRAYCQWETELEFRYAQDILSGRETDLSNYLLNERFEVLVKRELSLLDGDSPQRVLFIGSGPLPISAFHVQRMINRPIDCLDRDPEAVAMSQEVIARLGYSDSVRVFQGMGETFKITDYDLILVALLAKPKRRILRNLRKRAAPDCRILCRTSYGLRTLVYEATPEDVLAGFHVDAQQIAEGEQTISTLLLEGTTHKAPNVKLRWLDEIDEASTRGILRVMNRVLKNETTIGFPSPLDPATGSGLISQLNEDLKTQRRYVLIAENGETVVGQVILTPHHLPNCKHLVELSRGIIDPSFRGAGLALSAFREIAKKCDEIGGELIYLDVRAGTMAAELWKAFGFVPFGKLPDYARVSGRRYQGLYMSQTVASLKQHIERIAMGRKALASTQPEQKEEGFTPWANFRKRRVQPLEPLEFADWRLKVHGINAEGVTLGPALIDAAHSAAQKILPQPGVAPPQRYGLGFMIVHAGLDADFVVIGWWGKQNELFLRVLTAPPGQPQQLRERVNMDGSIACVWDLAVIWSEREAWTKYMMCSESPDAEGYLGATQEGEI